LYILLSGAGLYAGVIAMQGDVFATKTYDLAQNAFYNLSDYQSDYATAIQPVAPAMDTFLAARNSLGAICPNAVTVDDTITMAEWNYTFFEGYYFVAIEAPDAEAVADSISDNQYIRSWMTWIGFASMSAVILFCIVAVGVSSYLWHHWKPNQLDKNQLQTRDRVVSTLEYLSLLIRPIGILAVSAWFLVSGLVFTFGIFVGDICVDPSTVVPASFHNLGYGEDVQFYLNCDGSGGSVASASITEGIATFNTDMVGVYGHMSDAAVECGDAAVELYNTDVTSSFQALQDNVMVMEPYGGCDVLEDTFYQLFYVALCDHFTLAVYHIWLGMTLAGVSLFIALWFYADVAGHTDADHKFDKSEQKEGLLSDSEAPALSRPKKESVAQKDNDGLTDI
jgi:hypothetical protein